MMLKADYLVIGAGAMGMAFADSIIHNTQSSLIIVDKTMVQVATGMSLTRTFAYTSHLLFMVLIPRSWVVIE